MDGEADRQIQDKGTGSMYGILVIISRLIYLYEIIIFIRCILSFVQPDPRNPIVRFIYQITDPLMDAVRRAFPFLAAGGIDFSPIVIIFLLEATRHIIL
jgi:YggT family protein